MSNIALRCRTCEAVGSDVSVANGQIVLRCAKCADRAPVRCPGCRRALAAQTPELARCACGRSWRVEDGSLRANETAGAVDDGGVRVAPSQRRRAVADEAIKNDVSSPIEVRELPIEGNGGYRNARSILEVRRAQRSVEERIRSIPGFLLSCGALLAFSSAVSVCVILPQATTRMGGIALIALAPLFVLAFFVAGRLANAANERGRRTERRRLAEQAIRLGPERLERSEGRGWRPVASTASVSDVRLIGDADNHFRVRIELTAGDKLDVLEGLTQNEAVEVEERIRGYLARQRE